jgi:hypothetical protein
MPTSASTRGTHPTLARWFCVASLALIGVATLTPQPSQQHVANFCLICGVYGGVDAILNVFLFIPLGISLALARTRTRSALAAILGLSLAIEALQLFAIPGRDASAGDVVTNAIGGSIGFVVGGRLSDLMRPAARVATWLTALWLALWLGAQFVFAYSLRPAMPAPPYFGQIARPLGADAVTFPGDVLSVSLGSEPITKWRQANSAQLRTLLSNDPSPPLRVSVVAHAVPRSIAEIVSLSSAKAEDVFGFAGEDGDLLYTFRTGASVLRLRPLAYRLRDAFRTTVLPDTVRLEAIFRRGQVQLSAETGVTRSQVFQPRPSYAWMLFTPVQIYVDGGMLLVLASMIFLSITVLPAAFWTAAALTHRSAAGTRGGTGMLVALWSLSMAGGLLAAPLLFGLPPVAWWETVAVAISAGSAIFLGSRMRAHRNRSERDRVR